MKNRWSRAEGDFKPSDPKIESFLDEIQSVCTRHRLVISHEDRYGSFEILEFNAVDMGLLRSADDARKPQ